MFHKRSPREVSVLRKVPQTMPARLRAEMPLYRLFRQAVMLVLCICYINTVH